MACALLPPVRTFPPCMLFLAAALTGSPAAAATYDSPAALADAALAAQPGLQAAQAQVDAMQAAVDGSLARPDPTVSVDVMAPVPSLDVASDMMSGVEVGVGLPLLLPGVRDARQATAQAGVAMAEVGLRDRALALQAEVHQAWWLLVRARQLQALGRTQLDRLAELEATVRSRYETGEAGSHALVRVGLMRADMADMLREHDTQEAALLAALARATADPALALATAGPPEPVAPPADVEGWLDAARADNPMLAMTRAQEQEAQARAHQARTDARVMPMVHAGYRYRPGHSDDMVMVGASVPIGVGMARMGRSMEAMALAEARAAQAEGEAVDDMLEAELRELLAMWRRADTRARVVAEQLLPQARLALDASLSDYRVGMAAFADVIDAELMLIDLERELLQHATESRVLQARVGGLTGSLP